MTTSFRADTGRTPANLRLATALARAEAGRRIDALLEAIEEPQQAIDAAPTLSLQNAAVKLCRLGAYIEKVQPMRLLAGALSAVE